MGEPVVSSDLLTCDRSVRQKSSLGPSWYIRTVGDESLKVLGPMDLVLYYETANFTSGVVVPRQF